MNYYFELCLYTFNDIIKKNFEPVNVLNDRYAASVTRNQTL